jgi:predicted RND superfamily exporter protein
MPWKRLVSRIAVLLTAGALLGGLTYSVIKRVSFNANPLAMLPEDLPEVAGLKIYQMNFSSQHDIIVALHSENPDDCRAAARSLGTQLETLVGDSIKRVSWRPPFLSDAPDVQALETDDPTLDGSDPVPVPDEFSEPAEEINPQSGELVAFVWMNQDPSHFEALADRLAEGNSASLFKENFRALEHAVTADDMAEAGFGYDPLTLLRPPGQEQIRFEKGNSNRIAFASEDGTMRAVLVEAFGSNMYDFKQTISWTATVSDAIHSWHDNFPLKESVRVDITGRAPYITEISGAMQSEMNSSIFFTVIIILSLYWIMYRRILPLVFLMVSLFITFLVTLLLGGLVYPELNTMSLGFAAILIGLVVDYGFVVFQESLETDDETAAHLRSRLVRTIGWAALTTAVVFVGLNLSSLPGAAQLGTMVAIGIGVGAVTMLYLFTWFVIRFRRPHAPNPISAIPKTTGEDPWPGEKRILLFSAVVIAGALIVLVTQGLPALSRSPEAVRPKKSPIWDNYEKVVQVLSPSTDSLMAVAAGPDLSTIREKLSWMDSELTAMKADGLAVVEWSLPTGIWPNPENLAANRKIALTLSQMAPRLRAESNAAGFDDSSMRFTTRFLDALGELGSLGGQARPDNEVSRWVTDKILSLSKPELAAAGSVSLTDDCTDEQAAAIIARLTQDNDGTGSEVYLASWNHLAPAIWRLIKRDIYTTILPIAAMILVMLAAVFRDVRGTVLSLATLGVSGLLHLAFMKLIGEEWNVINIVAIPLLLGVGLDYSIHMQLAIRRQRCILRAQRTLGRALLLCGLSTATGFGALSFSSNLGLSSLGLVCAAGILITMFVAVYLLPGWSSLWDKRFGSLP